MSNLASYARVNGRYRALELAEFTDPSELEALLERRRLSRLELMISRLTGDVARQTAAIRSFGVAVDELPETTDEKTTVTPVRVLPAEMTETLRRFQEMREGHS